MIKKCKELYGIIKIPTIYSLVAVLCCYVSIPPLLKDVGFSLCVLLCVLSYISSMTIKQNGEYVFALASKWWEKVLLAILFVLFNAGLYGIVFLEDYSMDGYKLGKATYIPIALVWTVPLFLGFIRLIACLMSIPLGKKSSLTWKQRAIAFVILIANYGLWLYAFNPCITSYDSYDLFNQAHQMLTVPMGDGHPPFYTIVLSLLLKICDSVTFIVALQCIAFAILLVSMVDFLLKHGCKKIVAAVVYIVLGFGFNHVMQMVTLWKDIPFTISILWLTYLLSQFVIDKFDVKLDWYVKLVIAMVFTSFFRHNGAPAAYAIALFITLFGIFKRNIKALISIAAFVLVVVLIKGPVYSFYKVQGDPGFKYSAMANDLMGVYYDVDNPSEELVEMVNRITDDEPGGFPYYAYYTENSGHGLSEYSVTEFLSLYLKTFKQYPKELFKHFMQRNTVIWSIVRTEEEVANSIDLHSDFHMDGAKYTYPKRVENVFTNIISGITKRLTDINVVFIFAWRTAIYTLTLLATLVYTVCKKKFAGLLVSVPVLINIFVLMAASGWTCYRYYWPTAVMTLFIVPFLHIYVNCEKEDNKL